MRERERERARQSRTSPLEKGKEKLRKRRQNSARRKENQLVSQGKCVRVKEGGFEKESTALCTGIQVGIH